MGMSPPLTLLVFAVFPLWCLASFADWVCHRRTAIALTSGLGENALHWLMALVAGAGIALALFFETDAGLLGLLLLLFLAHEATAAWDLADNTLRRDVGPGEQLVHSAQEMLPLVAIALLALDAWPGLQPLDWSLHPRGTLPPLPWLAAGGVLVLGLVLLPLLQETVSCLGGRAALKSREQARARARVEPGLDPVRPRTPANPAPR